eukprot:gene15003-21070_t
MHRSVLCSKAVALSMAAVDASGLSKADLDRVKKEVKQYIGSGSLSSTDSLTELNPTFLLAPEMQYTVYFSTSIFRAVRLGKGTTAKVRLLDTLAPQFDSLAAALRNGDLEVTVVPADILTTLTSQESSKGGGTVATGLFDFIDCSNVSDYVSVPAMVQACAPLLRPMPHARLYLESIVSYSLEKTKKPTLKPSSFIETQTALPLSVYEPLIQLKFVKGVDVPELQAAIRMTWPYSSPRKGVPGAPLTFLHMLTVRGKYVDDADSIVRELIQLDTSGQGALFKWELTMQAQIQASNRLPLCRMAYAPKISSTMSMSMSMLTLGDSAIVLVISKVVLQSNSVVTRPVVKQLLSSFDWDEQQGSIDWVLPQAIAEQCESWFVTLCLLEGWSRLQVLGQSAKIGDL